MKNIDEKEKKLKDTLKKLGEINIQHNEELDKVAILKDQKNQLEIEKTDNHISPKLRRRKLKT